MQIQFGAPVLYHTTDVAMCRYTNVENKEDVVIISPVTYCILVAK